MGGYNFSSDNIDKLGFIDKQKILSYVTEKQVYELVFGFQPEEYQYVTSPLRDDTNPGCWFERTIYGLLFRDFAYKNKPLDCFDVVQDYFKLPNFYATLEFVYNKLIKNKPIQLQKPEEYFTRGNVEIFCESRNFINEDRLFWSKYEISKNNLIMDKVFPVRNYSMTNTKSGDINKRVREICYAFAEFEPKKKLYFPKRSGTNRFISNCRKDDIGGLSSLAPFGDTLIISKSYKDWRVLKNQGKHVIWLQNEGMIPSLELLFSIIKRFKRIIILFDNDTAGIEASQKIATLINNYYPGKATPSWLPIELNQQGISDPADLLCERSKEELNRFLNLL